MKYGDKVFLDTRNNENMMNCINMQYMTFVVIDGNKEMIPASESFVFQESKELYGQHIFNAIGMRRKEKSNAGWKMKGK